MKNDTSSHSIADEKVNEKSELEMLKEQFAEQQKLLNMLLKKSNKTPKDKLDDERLDIRPDAYVKIISLTDQELNISSEPRFQGKRLTFTHFGETKKILYSEFLNIKENHKNFFEQGKFYLLDDGRGIIKSLGLEELYDHILTKENMERILDSNSEAFNLFQSANPGQQKVIIDMIIKKMRDGGIVDHNLVAEITKFSGVKIEERVEQAIADTEFEKNLKD